MATDTACLSKVTISDESFTSTEILPVNLFLSVTVMMAEPFFTPVIVIELRLTVAVAIFESLEVAVYASVPPLTVTDVLPLTIISTLSEENFKILLMFSSLSLLSQEINAKDAKQQTANNIALKIVFVFILFFCFAQI